MKPYCVQNDGDCSTCSLVNYGYDCMNQKADTIECAHCGEPFEYINDGVDQQCPHCLGIMGV